MSLSLQQAEEKVEQFCQDRDWDQFHQPKDLAIGLVTEASELLELFRFQSEKQISELFTKAEFREKVSDELADVFFFLLRFSKMHKIDLTTALENKLVKNNEKYPVEYSKGNNTKYTDLRKTTKP